MNQMSATQFAPDSFACFDPGNIQEVLIDGMCCYAVKGGLVRTAFYSAQPIIGGDFNGPHEMVRTVVLKLVYTLDTQATMRRQMLSLIAAGERASFQDVLLNG